MDTTPAELGAPLHRPVRFSDLHPSEHLFRVEVQVLGLALAHRWTGWAKDSSEASRRGYADARQLFTGHALCVRNVVQVGL